MGPRASGFLPQLQRQGADADDGRPQSTYIVRFRNVGTTSSRTSSAATVSRAAAAARSIPAYAPTVTGFGSDFKKKVRDCIPTPISYGGFGEVLAREENQVSLDPTVKDAWGIPVLKFDFKFGDNEKAMAKDMADTAEEMLRAVGAEDITVRREPLTEGWSIHEMGTARMGNDPKTSVTNSFGQTHDIKNLFLVDGSIFVSASCQNPTWMIMALCWRAWTTSKKR